MKTLPRVGLRCGAGVLLILPVALAVMHALRLAFAPKGMLSVGVLVVLGLASAILACFIVATGLLITFLAIGALRHGPSRLYEVWSHQPHVPSARGGSGESDFGQRPKELDSLRSAKDPQERAYAAAELGRMGGAANSPYHAEALSVLNHVVAQADTPDAVRASALGALAAFEPEEAAVDTILELVFDLKNAPYVRRAALSLLSRGLPLSTKFFEAICFAGKSDPDTQWWCAVALEKAFRDANTMEKKKALIEAKSQIVKADWVESRTKMFLTDRFPSAPNASARPASVG